MCHAIYDLKESLCKELEEYGQKEKLDVGDLDIVDKLAHATKNLDKIIEKYEEEAYSHRNYYGGMRRGSYGMRYDDGFSYARRGRGSYARGGNGGYSSDTGMVEELREMMMDAPDDRTRQKFHKLIEELERM